MVESQDYTLPLTPNAHTPSPPSMTYQPSLNTRDEHKAPSSLDILMVDDERYSTTTRTSNLALIPTTPAPSSLILWGPAPPQTFEDRQDKVFAPLDRSIIAQRSCSSTSTHTSNTRDLGNLKDNAKIGGPNEQVTEEVEVAKEGEVTQVPCTHSPSIQLTPVQGEVTRGLNMVSTRKSSLSTLLQPLSMASWPSSMVSLPSSMARTPSPSSASRSMPTTPYMSNSNSNPHWGSTIPLPCSISLMHSFANTIHRCLTRSPPTRHYRCSTLTVPFYSPSNSQKRLLKALSCCFQPSSIGSLTTTPSQRQSVNSYLACPSYDPFQPHRDDRQPPEESALPITAYNMNGTLSSIRDVPSISSPTPLHDLSQYMAPPHSWPSTPSLPKRRSSSLPPTFRLKNCSGQQLLRAKPSVPVVGEGSCSPLSIHQNNPSRFPSATNSSSIPHQQQLHIQNEHSRTPPSQSAPTIECKGFALSLTSHMPYPSPRTNLPNPGTRDEHKALPSPDIHKVDDEPLQSPICNRLLVM